MIPLYLAQLLVVISGLYWSFRDPRVDMNDAIAAREVQQTPMDRDPTLTKADDLFLDEAMLAMAVSKLRTTCDKVLGSPNHADGAAAHWEFEPTGKVLFNPMDDPTIQINEQLLRIRS